MVVRLGSRGQKSDPPKPKNYTVRSPSGDGVIEESLHPAEASVSQARRQITLATHNSHGSRSCKKLVIYDSGDAYLVDETMLDDQRVRIQCVLPSRFLEQLFGHFFGTEISDDEAEDDLEFGRRLIETDQARNTWRPTRNERSTCTSSGMTRSMHDNAVPPSKRRKPSTKEQDTVRIDHDDDESDADLPDVWEGTESELEYIRHDEIYERFYRPNFKFLGQLACKDIGRTWIKMGHPRKQSQYPYNGGSTAVESQRLYGYRGELSKPPWWPPSEGWVVGLGCRHIEPDHQRRLERVFLLIHLLRYGGQFNLEKLKESTANIDQEYPKNWDAEKIKRLALIYRIRQKEIDYQDGLVDSDAKVCVPIPNPGKGKGRIAPKAEGPTCVKKEHSRRQPKERATMPAPTADMGIKAAAQAETKATLTAKLRREPSIIPNDGISAAEDTADKSTINPSTFEIRSTRDNVRDNAPTRSCGFPTGQQHAHAQGPRRHQAATRRSSQIHRASSQATDYQRGGLPANIHSQATPRQEPMPQQQMPCFTPAQTPTHMSNTSPFFNDPAFQQSHPPIIPSQGYPVDPNQAREVELVYRPCRIRKSSTVPAPELPDQTPEPYYVAFRVPTYAPSYPGPADLDTSSTTPWSDYNWSMAQQGTEGPIYSEGANPNVLLTSHPNMSGASCVFGGSDMKDGSGEPCQSGGPFNAYYDVPQAQDEGARQEFLNWSAAQNVDDAGQMYQVPSFGDGTTGFEPTYELPHGPR